MQLNRLNWTENEYESLVSYLKEISDDKYKNFHKSLVPGLDNILGIQLPKLRVIAKGISLGNYTEFLEIAKHNYYEETLLQGLVIGYAKIDYDTTIKLIKGFLPHISNWAICDSFCTKFKAVIKNREEFLVFLKECINSGKEYYIRFAVVMLKVMYVDKEYIDIVLNILDEIYHEEYYVKMAVAWTLCDCFIKFRVETMEYLESSELDNFTYNKALQKIIESRRVDDKTKEIIRGMKRK